MTRGGNPARALLAGSYAVFERDFLVATSKRRFLVMRFLVVALVSALVLLWPAMVSNLFGNRTADPSQIGRQVFNVAAFSLPLLLMFVAPAVSATSIVSERTLRTLPIVLTTPVGPFSFLLAKFASRAGAVMIFVLGCLPPAAICFLFGGVSAIQFVDFVILCIGIAVVGVALGIAVSTYSNKAATAVLATYGIAIFGQFIVGLALGIVAENTKGMNLEDLPFAMPAFQWFALLSAGAKGTESSLLYLGLMSGIALIALLMASRRLAREGGPANEKKARRGRLCKPARFSNPVLDHALRGSFLHGPSKGAFGMLSVVLLATGGGLALGASENDLDKEWPYYMAMLVTSAVVAFRALAAGANAIAIERQTGALDVLMATRLRLDEVVRGKALGISMGSIPYLAVPFAAGAVASIAGTKVEAAGVLVWLAATVSVTLLFGAVGLWFSARNSTPGKATLRAFGFTVGGLIGHIVSFALLLGLLFRHASDNNVLFWLYLEASPAATLISTTIFGQELASSSHSSNQEVLGVCVGAGYLVLYLLLARAIVRGLPARIRKNLERGEA